MVNSSVAHLFNGEPCPPFMTTVGSGSRALSDCVCVAGTYGNYSSGCIECLGMQYCPQNSLVPTECPEGYNCTPSLATPLPGNWVNGSFELCPVGFFCSSWNSTPTECGVGMFCGKGTLSPEPCPAGRFCDNASTLEPEMCPAGSYCEIGSSVPLICPVSKYCPLGSDVGIPCDPGYVCAAGSANQTECSAGYVCEMGAGTMTPCPENHFCPLKTSHPIECPVGSYCKQGTEEFPTQCAAGYYGESPWCVQCPALMESADKATTCVCIPGYFFVFDNASAPHTRVLENGKCVSTSLFCPRNSFCSRDGVALPCPPGSTSPGGITEITDCVCDNGGKVMGFECVNGTAAPASAASSVSVVAIAGGAAAGGVVVIGGAVAVAVKMGVFGASAVASTAAPAGASLVGTAGAGAVFDTTGLVLRIPWILQEVRIDLQRKTV